MFWSITFINLKENCNPFVEKNIVKQQQSHYKNILKYLKTFTSRYTNNFKILIFGKANPSVRRFPRNGSRLHLLRNSHFKSFKNTLRKKKQRISPINFLPIPSECFVCNVKKLDHISGRVCRVRVRIENSVRFMRSFTAVN